MMLRRIWVQSALRGMGGREVGGEYDATAQLEWYVL